MMLEFIGGQRIVGLRLSRFFVLLLLTMAAGAACPRAGVRAQDGDTQAAARVMSFRDCLEIAIAQNPDIDIRNIDVFIAHKEIEAEAAEFDPAFSARMSFGDSRRPTSSIVTGNRRKTTELDFEYGGKVEDGDEYAVSMSQVKQDTNSTFSALNPSYTLDFEFSYTHPLLQGKGRDVNLAGLQVTSLNRALSELDVINEVMNVAYLVESAYWDLFYAREALEVRRESLVLAEKTLERTRVMVAAGAMAENQILLVETQLAQREEDVIAAGGDVDRAVLALKLVMNVDPDSELWDTPIAPGGAITDRPARGDAAFEDTLAHALARRPDYQAALRGLELQRIRTVAARDAARVSLDLETSVGLGGLQDDYGGSLQDVTSLEYPSWEVGLWMDLPVGRRKARARLEQSLAGENRASLEIVKTRQEISVEIADAEVGLVTAEKRVAAAEATRAYTEERLREETDKREYGLATTHDVLEYQDELALAKLNRTRADIDYNKALLDFYYATGTILEVNGIDIESPEIPLNQSGQEVQQ